MDPHHGTCLIAQAPPRKRRETPCTCPSNWFEIGHLAGYDWRTGTIREVAR